MFTDISIVLRNDWFAKDGYEIDEKNILSNIILLGSVIFFREKGFKKKRYHIKIVMHRNCFLYCIF